MILRRPSVTRRAALAGAGAAVLAAQTHAAPAIESRIFATGLQAPESPKPLSDGSVLVVEMARGTLSRVSPDGVVSVVADLGGRPNGCAIGPDGAVYVVNAGGAQWRREGDLIIWAAPADPPGKALVQRVHLATGAFSTLYAATEAAPLAGPNDIVFDRHGGFYFSDTRAPTGGELGAVYYAKADGSMIRRLADVPFANGIVLSPRHDRLLVASPMQILEFEVVSPGQLALDRSGVARSRVFGRISEGRFDSMAVEADGGIVAGTLMIGALTDFAPDGAVRSVVPLAPERSVTNLGFGGSGLTTAYVSLSQTGKLAAVEWPRPGLRLANQ